MNEITPERLERARMVRDVGTAVSLFTSGKFLPRLMIYGSAVRMALSRTNRKDLDDNLPELFADAILFGQVCESQVLGIALPDPATFSPGVQVTLARAVSGADLWRPVVKSIVNLLLRDGRVTGAQITAIAERGNTGGGHSTGERLRKSQTEKEFQL